MAMSPEQRQKRIEARKGIALQFREGTALEDISDTLVDIWSELSQIKAGLGVILQRKP